MFAHAINNLKKINNWLHKVYLIIHGLTNSVKIKKSTIHLVFFNGIHFWGFFVSYPSFTYNIQMKWLRLVMIMAFLFLFLLFHYSSNSMLASLCNYFVDSVSVEHMRLSGALQYFTVKTNYEPSFISSVLFFSNRILLFMKYSFSSFFPFAF